MNQGARTIKKIAARRGHPELAKRIADLNNIRSITQKLKIGRRLRLPGTLEQQMSFDVYPQDLKRPLIKDGYAMFTQAARFGEKSITQFTGYNALAMDVYIQFEAWQQQDGSDIEDKIRKLERMAGRGPGFAGAASGPPAVVRLSVTDAKGSVVPLIPLSWQWSPGAAQGLLWVIEGIDWDDGALSDSKGQRIRASATVHMREFTDVNLTTTAVQRHKRKQNPKTTGATLTFPDTSLGAQLFV